MLVLRPTCVTQRPGIDIDVSFKTYLDDPERPGMDVAVSFKTYLCDPETRDRHRC